MRKKISVFLALCLTILCFQTNMTYAETNKFGSLYYKEIDGGIEISGLDYSFTGELEIPAKINNKDVISIGASAFYCDNFTSVTIPSSVKIIKDSAFEFCTKLKTITFLGDGLEIIEKEAFCDCYMLEHIELPKTVTSIGARCFINCRNIDEIDFSKSSITYLGGNMFYSCDNLTKITLPRDIEKIGDNFCYSDSLTTVVFTGNKVKSIGESAFSHCSNLSSINIPDSVTSIGDYAFYVNDSLKSIRLSANIKSIGDSAFPLYALKTVYCPYDSYAYKYFSDKSHIKIITGNAAIDNKNNNKVSNNTSPAKKITQLNKSNLNLTVGFKYKLVLQNKPAKVKWKSSNKKVATDTKKGVVKGKKKGKVTITATCKGKKYKCKVKVKSNETSIPFPYIDYSMAPKCVVYSPVKIKKSGKKYIVTMRIKNILGVNIIGMRNWNINLYANNKKFLSKQIKKKTFSLRNGASAKVKITFSGKAIKKKNVDLRNSTITEDLNDRGGALYYYR